MASRARDTKAYRLDEKSGHKLLTPEQRVQMLKPYLPSPPTRSPNRTDTKTRQRESWLGIRRFLRTQLHILVFTIIHAFFSLYIKIRQTYHVVRDRIYSIRRYHYRTPGFIKQDVKGLNRLPKHLSIILKLENNGRGGAELERLVNEVAEVSAWCASAGIPNLTVYEKTGILKNYLRATHTAISQNLASYFGPEQQPTLTLCAPHVQSIETESAAPSGHDGDGPAHLLVRLLSVEDGRDSMVDLTKTLTEMAQRSKLSPADISIDLIEAELSESVMDEPDLLILFSPTVELDGYPPWQVRLTEVFHVQDNESVGYLVFYRALCKYAHAEFRVGR